MKKILSLLLAILLLSGLCACGSTPAERTQDIEILYTNDVHCHMDDALGYAGVAWLKQQELSAGNAVILADGGDAIQGSSYGTLTEGSIPINMMNAVGYDVMALGNHEFDYGLDVLARRMEQASFPMLSLNFVSTDTDTPLYTPYTILERDGVRIAFIGITAPETVLSSDPEHFQDEDGRFLYDFMGDETGEALWSAVQSAVDEVRAAGADYVIALSHLGVIEATEPFTGNTLITSTTGIDAVLDGHSHTVVSGVSVKNADGADVLLAQTGTGLTGIGVLTIARDGSLSYRLVTETGADETIAALVEREKESVDDILQACVTTTDQTLWTVDPETGVRIVRNAETNLGDLCADAIRLGSGADIAIVNGGGVRTDLPAGAVTYGALLSVFPFDNNVCLIRVDGQTVLDMLEVGVSAVPEEMGGFLQVSGLTFTYDPTVPTPVVRDADGFVTAIGDGAHRVREVLVDGKPLDLTGHYTLAGSAYLLMNRGDGYTIFDGAELLNTGVGSDFDLLCAYMRQAYADNAARYADPYGEGRIVAVR